MTVPVSNLPGVATPPTDSFAQLSKLSATVGRINKALNFVNRDPGAKTVNINLNQDERDLIFSAGKGSVGRAILDTTLIVSAGRDHSSGKTPLANAVYQMTNISSSEARLNVYRSPGYKLSERVDLLV